MLTESEEEKRIETAGGRLCERTSLKKRSTSTTPTPTPTLRLATPSPAAPPARPRPRRATRPRRRTAESALRARRSRRSRRPRRRRLALRSDCSAGGAMASPMPSVAGRRRRRCVCSGGKTTRKKPRRRRCVALFVVVVVVVVGARRTLRSCLRCSYCSWSSKRSRSIARPFFPSTEKGKKKKKTSEEKENEGKKKIVVVLFDFSFLFLFLLTREREFFPLSVACGAFKRLFFALSRPQRTGLQSLDIRKQVRVLFVRFLGRHETMKTMPPSEEKKKHRQMLKR